MSSFQADVNSRAAERFPVPIFSIHYFINGRSISNKEQLRRHAVSLAHPLDNVKQLVAIMSAE